MCCGTDGCSNGRTVWMTWRGGGGGGVTAKVVWRTASAQQSGDKYITPGKPTPGVIFLDIPFIFPESCGSGGGGGGGKEER